MITDNSAAEQRDVNLTFRNLIDNEMKISHYFCRIHSKQTLNKKFVDDTCKIAKKHLYDVFYFKKIQFNCDDFLNKAIKSIFVEKRSYI